MATVIENLPTSTRKGGGSKYDWDTLLDGQAWLLKRGEDFACEAQSLRTAAYTAARGKGLEMKSRVFTEDDVEYFALQVTGPIDESKPKRTRRSKKAESNGDGASTGEAEPTE